VVTLGSCDRYGGVLTLGSCGGSNAGERWGYYGYLFGEWVLGVPVVPTTDGNAPLGVTTGLREDLPTEETDGRLKVPSTEG